MELTKLLCVYGLLLPDFYLVCAVTPRICFAMAWTAKDSDIVEVENSCWIYSYGLYMIHVEI